MVKTKVFVGNLSFKTQESDLVREFERAGKVSGANIISRGNRSLGYGFVEMESEEDANKAVQLLSKAQVDGREINVEVAKPRAEGEAAQRAPRQRRPRPAGNDNANGAAGAEGEQGETAARRRRPARRPSNNNNNNGGQRERRPRLNADGTPAEGQQGAQGERAPRPRRERAPRQPRPEGERAPRIAAPNTLFVANLPFSVDDGKLAEIFAGLNLKAAHVVRKRNDRSKGFGFVEFNNEEDQKKALAAVDKKNVDNRELIVKIALTEVTKEGGDKDATSAVKNASNTPGSPKPNPQ